MTQMPVKGGRYDPAMMLQISTGFGPLSQGYCCANDFFFFPESNCLLIPFFGIYLLSKEISIYACLLTKIVCWGTFLLMLPYHV